MAGGDPRVSGAIAATRMMIPGVQNPHCDAPPAANAPTHRSRSGSPSSVVTSRPATRATGVTQAIRGEPSIQTVQQPHWPWGLQPSFAERTPRRSRRTSRSEPPSSITSTRRLLRENEVRSAEGLAAAAGTGGVRVRDREPGLLEAVLVVERGAQQQLRRSRVDDHLHGALGAELGLLVVRCDLAVEE